MTHRIPMPWPTPPLTQNQVRRLHYQHEAKLKRAIIAEAIAAIRAAKVEPMTSAEVSLHYRPGTRRRFDADGIAVTLKCCLDALVHAEILHDDGWQHVPAVHIRIHPPVPGFAGCIWVELEEVADAA